MTGLQILILAAVQGAAELLPVSSSAHVIVIAKLMGLNPTTPEMTLLLVMLHTGTMFAVICYFWRSWRASFFASRKEFLRAFRLIMISTVLTGMVGLVLKALIERIALREIRNAQIELLFGNLGLIATALATAGVLIVVAGLRGKPSAGPADVGVRESVLIGMVQGLCLPFRGFSRSGATISAGLLAGVAREKAEAFSFALAVVLTPPVIAREVWRLMKAQTFATPPQGSHLAGLFLPGIVGMVLSFLAGILALRWLSSWLEKGRWQFFGYYCLVAASIVFIFHRMGI